jgi:hypothetical protein
MRKFFFILSIAVFTLSCDKQDTTPPTITLNGAENISLYLYQTYTEAGAEATDEKDGNLTSFIERKGSVNTTQTGLYVLTYEVADFAGNTANVKRYVTIKSHVEYLAGNFQAADTINSSITNNNGIFNYSTSIYFSTFTDSQIVIQNFGNKGNTVSVLASVNGNAITISAQSPTGMQVQGQITGSGTVVNNNLIRLQYYIDYPSVPGGPEDTAKVSLSRQ